MKYPLIIKVRAQEQQLLYGSLVLCLLALFWFMYSLFHSSGDTVRNFLQPALFLTIVTLTTYWIALHVHRPITH